MNVKSKNIKSNLKKADKHSITKNEYAELPELTDEMLGRAVYKVSGVTKPAPKRRGAQKKPVKIALHLRLPRDVVTYFKQEGPGWQTRIGLVLEDWMKLHPHH